MPDTLGDREDEVVRDKRPELDRAEVEENVALTDRVTEFILEKVPDVEGDGVLESLGCGDTLDDGEGVTVPVTSAVAMGETDADNDAEFVAVSLNLDDVD